MSNSDYHDYVFKDGRLVGKFEEMYRHAKDVPWHQDKQNGWIDIRIELEIIRDFGPFDHIHDFACGLGYYLDTLRKNVGTQGCRASGSDISPTACAKATALFPDAEFTVEDLTNSKRNNTLQAGRKERGLYTIRGSLWYVYPHVELVVSNISNRVGLSDVLLVSQNFPPLDSNFVGKDVIPDPQRLQKCFSSHLRCKRSLWYEDHEANKNDNWFIGVFAK